MSENGAAPGGHGRDAIGIDLDPRNADLALQRGRAPLHASRVRPMRYSLRTWCMFAGWLALFAVAVTTRMPAAFAVTFLWVAAWYVSETKARRVR